MRNLLIMAAIAIGFGALAVWGMSAVIDGRRAPEAQANILEPVATIVVAGRDIAPGTRIGREDLREIAWSLSERPQGAHERIDVFLAGERQLYAAAAVPALVPLLDGMLVEDPSRLPAASRLGAGRRAMALRLDEAVLAGQKLRAEDRIDILMSHPGIGPGNSAYVDVILEDIRVLALEELPEGARPGTQRSLTLEVTTEEAQILTLATRTGMLSFIVRGLDPAIAEQKRRVTLGEVLGVPQEPEIVPEARPEIVPQAAPAAARKPSTTSIRVNRNGGRTEYDVNVSP